MGFVSQGGEKRVGERVGIKKTSGLTASVDADVERIPRRGRAAENSAGSTGEQIGFRALNQFAANSLTAVRWRDDHRVNGAFRGGESLLVGCGTEASVNESHYTVAISRDNQTVAIKIGLCKDHAFQ